MQSVAGNLLTSSTTSSWVDGAGRLASEDSVHEKECAILLGDALDSGDTDPGSTIAAQLLTMLMFCTCHNTA